MLPVKGLSIACVVLLVCVAAALCGWQPLQAIRDRAQRSQAAPQPAESSAPSVVAQDEPPTRAIANYGVRVEKISKAERCTVNGFVVTKERLLDSLADNAGGSIPNDADKLSLALNLPDAERQRALASLAAPGQAALREHVLIQDYSPDAPMMRARGFEPGIFLQKPDGFVLASVPSFEGSSTWRTLEAALPDFPAPSVLPPAILLVGGMVCAVAGIAFLRRKAVI